MSTRAAIIAVLAYLLLGLALLANKSPSTDYSAGVNACLNEQLVIACEWHSLGVKFTWKNLADETARRLGVNRNEPWGAKQ